MLIFYGVLPKYFDDVVTCVKIKTNPWGTQRLKLFPFHKWHSFWSPNFSLYVIFIKELLMPKTFTVRLRVKTTEDFKCIKWNVSI